MASPSVNDEEAGDYSMALAEYNDTFKTDITDLRDLQKRALKTLSDEHHSSLYLPSLTVQQPNGVYPTTETFQPSLKMYPIGTPGVNVYPRTTSWQPEIDVDCKPAMMHISMATQRQQSNIMTHYQPPAYSRHTRLPYQRPGTMGRPVARQQSDYLNHPSTAQQPVNYLDFANLNRNPLYSNDNAAFHPSQLQANFQANAISRSQGGSMNTGGANQYMGIHSNVASPQSVDMSPQSVNMSPPSVNMSPPSVSLDIRQHMDGTNSGVARQQAMAQPMNTQPLYPMNMSHQVDNLDSNSTTQNLWNRMYADSHSMNKHSLNSMAARNQENNRGLVKQPTFGSVNCMPATLLQEQNTNSMNCMQQVDNMNSMVAKQQLDDNRKNAATAPPLYNSLMNCMQAQDNINSAVAEQPHGTIIAAAAQLVGIDSMPGTPARHHMNNSRVNAQQTFNNNAVVPPSILELSNGNLMNGMQEVDPGAAKKQRKDRNVNVASIMKQVYRSSAKSMARPSYPNGKRMKSTEDPLKWESDRPAATPPQGVSLYTGYNSARMEEVNQQYQASMNKIDGKENIKPPKKKNDKKKSKGSKKSLDSKTNTDKDFMDSKASTDKESMDSRTSTTMQCIGSMHDTTSVKKRGNNTITMMDAQVMGDEHVVVVSRATDVVDLTGDLDVMVMPETMDVIDSPGAMDVINLPGSTDVMDVTRATDVVDSPGVTDVIDSPGATDVMDSPGATDVMVMPGRTDVMDLPRATAVNNKLLECAPDSVLEDVLVMEEQYFMYRRPNAGETLEQAMVEIVQFLRRAEWRQYDSLLRF